MQLISPLEKNLQRVIDAVNNLIRRAQLKGRVTIEASTTTTLVRHPNVNPDVRVAFIGEDATTRSEIAADTLYSLPADMDKGEFTIHHPSGSERTVTWFGISTRDA